jgi:SAM-dependent methyltransferase
MSDMLLRVMRGVNGQSFRTIGNKILQGPFSGMIIPAQTPQWDDGNSGTKLMGVYEHEIQGAIVHAIERSPSVVINVGCGEGYYAIGLAGLLPKATVFALDICEQARLMCADYAQQNAVELNIIDGARTAEELRFASYSGNRFYIVDCEGHEIELLNLDRCPELRTADIIVECHDFLRPDASKILAKRFAETHDVTLVRAQLPDFGKFEFLRQYPSAMAVLLVVEKRPMPCYWLTCWAKQKELNDG